MAACRRRYGCGEGRRRRSRRLGVGHKRRQQLGGEERSKIGQNCAKKTADMGVGGGSKNPEKLTTSFMDGPLACWSLVRVMPASST